MRQALHKFDKVTEMPPEPEPEPGPDLAAEAQALQEVEIQKQALGYRDNLTIAKELAREDPRIVANVVKAWLGTNE
jgi:flagellar M-ring protein FliF